MGRSRFLIILLIFTVSYASAQSGYDFKQVDSITYANTMAGNWDEVISTGNAALEDGIDYFYLRLRLGIACFNKDNYRKASDHLAKAIEFNPDHGLTRKYLFNSYTYSGRDNEAALVAGRLNDRMREVSGIKKPKAFTLYLEAGAQFSDNFDKHELKQLPHRQEQRSQDLYGNSYYTQLGLKLQLYPRISMYAGFSDLNISKRAGLQYAWNSPDSIVERQWGFAKLFPRHPREETVNYDYSLKQNGIYLNAVIQLNRGWSITPAIHYIHVNTEQIDIINETTQAMDTARYYAQHDSVVYLYYQSTHFELSHTPLKLDNFIVSLGINKQVSVVDLGFFGSWSNLNDHDQIQFGISATYYPLGNLDFYGNTTLKGLSEENKTRPVFHQMLGVKLARFIWLEGSGTFGNIRGTNESNAFIVYNISDKINLIAAANITFVISPSVQFSLSYQYIKKQGYRTVLQPMSPRMGMSEELEYTNQGIIGGLKWSF